MGGWRERFPFVQRMMPLIERAAEAAREAASTSSANGAYLNMIRTSVRNRLMQTAELLETRERVAPDQWSEPMTREEFEEHLLRIGGVWVIEPEEDGDSAPDGYNKI